MGQVGQLGLTHIVIAMTVISSTASPRRSKRDLIIARYARNAPVGRETGAKRAAMSVRQSVKHALEQVKGAEMPDSSPHEPPGGDLDAAAQHALRTGWQRLAQERGFSEVEAQRLAFWRWQARSRAETSWRVLPPTTR